jgi:hypothetical protein
MPWPAGVPMIRELYLDVTRKSCREKYTMRGPDTRM